MNKIVKQLLTSATIVAFTACGGGGGTTARIRLQRQVVE